MQNDHFPHADELTSYQREKIEELRSKVAGTLATYPEYDTDFSLLRWLMGWNYNIDEIVPKLETAIRGLVGLGIPKLSVMNPREINACIRRLSPRADFFPGGVMSQDDDGNVVFVQPLCAVHPQSISRAGAVSELFRLALIEAELVFKLVRKEEAVRRKKLGVKLLIDLSGFHMGLIFPATFPIYLNLILYVQATFPDFARKIMIINAPFIIRIPYEMVKPVLSQQTRNKVVFLGENYREIIDDEIGTKNILPHWGGTMESEKPHGDLRLGGKVPEHLWYMRENNPFDVEESFTTLNIAPKGKQEVRIRGEKGKTFHWIFRVNNNKSIEFTILKDDKQIYPKFSLMTQFHPEIGSFKCPSDEEFLFLFYNESGGAKVVNYKIWLMN